MRLFLLALGLCLAAPALAFESDVHFGLTEWLALQAGYGPQEAVTIATGDQRVDSGDMQFMALAFAYACPGQDRVTAAEVEAHHFPSAAGVPAPPQQRAVLAGDEAAGKAVRELIATPPDKAGFMLLRFGESLHPLQDSWSHQGMPDLPQPFGGAVACAADSVSAAPKARGGWNSHKADLTRFWPADTLAMAKASYEALQNYPATVGGPRTARDWNELGPELSGFVTAATKTDKKNWFLAHGITDVSFLEGISLRDGAQPFDLAWPGRRLPQIASPQSGQHEVEAELREFFDRFFTTWATTGRFDELVRDFAPAKRPPREDALLNMGTQELAARLGLWRVHDHGQAAELAHAPVPLTRAQLAEAGRITAARGALARYASSREAFFPMLPRTKGASPLAPFIVVPLAPSPAGNPRALAAAKFRHAPYDTVAIAAERIDGRWCTVAVDSIVEH